MGWGGAGKSYPQQGKGSSYSGKGSGPPQHSGGDRGKGSGGDWGKGGGWGGKAGGGMAVPPPGKGTSCGPPAASESFSVVGCQHATIGNIVRGHFNRAGDNHGRPTFKKDTQSNGLDVMLYFWDERDGPALCGWWFGPKVGGDQVWAFHPSKDLRPPSSGWMVPFNGPLDPTLAIKMDAVPQAVPASSKGGYQQQSAYQQPAAVQPPAQATHVPPPSHAGGTMQMAQWSPNRPNQGNSYIQQQQQQQQQQQAHQQRLDENRRQQEEMRRRMEENKKKVEEANRKRREEQEAEAKRKVEEQRKRLEEMKKQKEEEERQKREAMEKRQLEMRATTEIRRVQQKVRVSKLENFEEAKKELEEVMERELPKVGDKQQQIQDECEAVVAQVQKRVEAVKEMKRKEEEKKLEEERKKREQEEKAEKLIEELKGLVEEAEKGLEAFKEKSDAFAEQKDLSLQAVEATSAALKEAAAEVEKLATDCSEFFRVNHPAMKLAPSTKPVDTGNAEKLDTRQLLAQLLQRTGTIKRESGAVVEKAVKIRTTLLTRAAAKEEEQQVEALFKRYDKNSDEMLSRKELSAFAKGELGFVVPEATMNVIWEHYTEYSSKHSETGVTFGSFELAKVHIGVAREMERDRQRRATREAALKRLEEMKAELAERIKKAAEAVSEADQSVSKAEEDVKPLQVKSKGMRVAEMKTYADEIGAIISKASAAVSVAQEKMDGLKQGIEEEFKAELLTYVANETKKHDSKLGRMDQRIKRATNLMARFQDEVGKKRAGEVEKVRTAALKVARYAQMMLELSDEDLFGRFDAGGTGAISEQDFIAWFETADKVIRPFKDDGAQEGDAEKEDGDAEKEKDKGKEKEEPESETIELAPEDLAEVFASFCEEGESTLSLEKFKQVVPMYMYVVKQTALTDGLCIKDSKTTRRLDLEEVVRVVKGPVKETASGVMRHSVMALKDGVAGWVSAVGNQGTVFLKEGGRQYKVVKETILTEGLEIDGDSSEAPRKLKVGDVVEVRQWPEKEPKSGLMRMRVCRKSDKAVGWVTATGNQGTVYLKIA